VHHKTNTDHWTTNNLLRSLHADDFALIKPGLQRWSAKTGTVIYEPGDDVRFAYFTCGHSLISYTVMMKDGRDVETGLIGREGAAGGIVSNGHLPAYARALVQAGGSFLRIDTQALDEAKSRSSNIRNLFARYADCMVAQIFQSVACNAVHTIEQRTARWILASVDRTGGGDISMTQDELASMLGFGRSYVNRILKSLQNDGVVQTRRGGLIVRNVQALQNIACECTDAIRRHFEEVLEGVYPNGRNE